jgi:AraC-like DNA-binding protein
MRLLKNVQREITPLTLEDSFLVFDRKKKVFDYPIHFHPEYELNFIKNGKGVKRFVGDSFETIDAIELVLVGPNLNHGWLSDDSFEETVHEITIQFHDSLFHEGLLAKKIMKPIKNMLERSSYGILFSKEISLELYDRISSLSEFQGMDYFIKFLSILQDLATSEGQTLLSNYAVDRPNFENNKRLELVYEYINDNFKDKIKLEDVSSLINMSNVSFNRFIKSRTGKTFIEYLNDIRISHASMKLIEGDHRISEIAFECGFNNIANFNRIFKKIKNCTPTEYKQEFSGIKRIF